MEKKMKKKKKKGEKEGKSKTGIVIKEKITN